MVRVVRVVVLEGNGGRAAYVEGTACPERVACVGDFVASAV